MFLWPLFHYIPLPIESLTSCDEQFSAYQKCNQLFAQAILANYQDGDVVWVHDYHLMLLPMYLRKAKPDMKIGFFLHTPFPSSEIYRVLPSRKELLYGVLCSNLIGFHTHDYGRHFQSACTRIIGANSSGDRVRYRGQVAQVETFPIGIDPLKFMETLKGNTTMSFQKELKVKFGGKKVILGIDRLDYIKGIAQKMYGLERFFEKHPEWIGKVVLVQIAVPSRTDVPEYQRLRASTHELVGRLNGKYGSLSSVPVHYLDQSIPFDNMCALYRISNCMLITSVRDGMNLVAYEYIACQEDGDGCLILSEFAGAAQSLGAGAIQVNPWNVNETADAIHQALSMSSKERQERMQYCFNHVITHTARAWARSFASALSSSPQLQSAIEVCDDGITPRPISSIPLESDTVLGSFMQSKHRVVITSLAGILSKARKIWRDAAGLKSEVPSELDGLEQCLEEGLEDQNSIDLERDPHLESIKSAVRALSEDPNTTFIILTCRSRDWCDRLFGTISDIWLCAENGLYVRRGGNDNKDNNNNSNGAAGSNPWQCMYEDLVFEWKDGVRKIFDYFTARTPNSYIVEEGSHMSWHYHGCDPVFARQQANDLISHLTGGPLSNTATEVVESHQIIQVTSAGITKGRAVKFIVNHLNQRRLKLTRQEGEVNSGDEHSAKSATEESSSASDEKSESRAQSGTPNLTSQPQSVSRRKSFSSLTSLTQSSETKYRTPVDFILCIGKVLERDVDLFTILNGWTDQHQINLGSAALPPSSQVGTPTASGGNMSRRNSFGAGLSQLGLQQRDSPGPSSRSFVFPAPSSHQQDGVSRLGGDRMHQDKNESENITNMFSPHVFAPVSGSGASGRPSSLNPNDLFGAPLGSAAASPFASSTASSLATARALSSNLSLNTDNLSVATHASTLPSPSPFMSQDNHNSMSASPPTTSHSLSSSLPSPTIFTVSIGSGPSKARYYIKDSESVHQLLMNLAAIVQHVDPSKIVELPNVSIPESMKGKSEKEKAAGEEEKEKEKEKGKEIPANFEKQEKQGNVEKQSNSKLAM